MSDKTGQESNEWSDEICKLFFHQDHLMEREFTHEMNGRAVKSWEKNAFFL